MLICRHQCLRGFAHFLAVAVAGCATTTIHSQFDPQATTRAYRRIAVVVSVNDFALQQEAERIVQARTAGHSTVLIPWHTLFFGGRQYSDQERLQVLRDANLDAVLVISPTGAGSVSAYVPETTTSAGAVTVDDDSASGSITTRSRGGYTVSAPTGTFRADLLDLAAGRSVWMAVMSTGPNDAISTAYGGITWKNLYKSMAQKTAEQLIRDRVVR